MKLITRSLPCHRLLDSTGAAGGVLGLCDDRGGGPDPPRALPALHPPLHGRR